MSFGFSSNHNSKDNSFESTIALATHSHKFQFRRLLTNEGITEKSIQRCSSEVVAP